MQPELTPCTQGCCSTWLALRRFLASRTRSLDIRSLALEEMWAQSFSGNSYFPSWILSNKVFCRWRELHRQPSLFLLISHCERIKALKCYLAGVTGFSQFPSTVTATSAHEGRITAQHDVEDNPEAPKVAALVVYCSLFTEGLNYFRCHVLCWATLREKSNVYKHRKITTNRNRDVFADTSRLQELRLKRSYFYTQSCWSNFKILIQFDDFAPIMKQMWGALGQP